MSKFRLPGQAAPLPAREVFGADSPWFDWMATNLALLDPASLAILLDEPERAAGYELEAVFAAIGCPVWLIQADPAAGGLMSDGEVRQAQQASALVRHRRLDGVGHPLHATHPELLGRVIPDCLRDIEQTAS